MINQSYAEQLMSYLSQLTEEQLEELLVLIKKELTNDEQTDRNNSCARFC